MDTCSKDSPGVAPGPGCRAPRSWRRGWTGGSSPPAAAATPPGSQGASPAGVCVVCSMYSICINYAQCAIEYRLQDKQVLMSTGSYIDKRRKYDNKPILFANNLNIISSAYFPFFAPLALANILPLDRRPHVRPPKLLWMSSLLEKVLVSAPLPSRSRSRAISTSRALNIPWTNERRGLRSREPITAHLEEDPARSECYPVTHLQHCRYTISRCRY